MPDDTSCCPGDDASYSSATSYVNGGTCLAKSTKVKHEEHAADHVERFADGLDEKRHEKDADGQATPHEVVGILGGVREGSLFFVVVDMFHGRERMQAHDSAASVVSGQRWERAPLLSTASVRSVDYTKKTHIIIYMYM